MFSTPCRRWVPAAILLACAATAAPNLARAQTAPAKPTGFTVVDGDKEIGLRWTGPNDATITKWQYNYKLVTDTSYGEWKDMEGSGPDTRRYIVTGLANNKFYNFKIRAVNDTGYGSQSSEEIGESYGFRPNKPTGLQAFPGNGTITLTWNEADYISIWGWEYELDKSENWESMISSDSSTTTYTIDVLENSTEYTFRIRSYNFFGNSPISDEASAIPMAAPPEKPTGFAAAAGDGQVSLNWNDPGNSSISGWQYSYKTSGDYGGWTGISGSGATTTAHTVTRTSGC